MPEIALINPPSPFLLDDKVFPPLGLLSISSYLKKYWHHPEVIDLAGGRGVGSIDADIVGIGATTPQYPEALKILYKLRMTGLEALYVIGGPHATCNPNTCLDFDVSVIGEGEQAMLHIAKDHPSDFPSRFTYQPFIENIDEIPFPDREAIDIHSYQYFIDDEPATAMITSRGCPYACGFCTSIWGRKVRMHSADYVINEIKEVQRLGFAGLMFFDDIFILDKHRLFKICEHLKNEHMVWRCFVRANLVSDEILRVIAESGCREIGIGVESGSQRILDVVNKGTTVQQNVNTIELAHKHKIRAKTFIIVGLPSESKETIAETERFLEKTKPDDLDVTIYQPFKDTPITNNPEKYDIHLSKIDPRYSFFKGIPGQYHSQVSTSGLSAEEIVAARDRIERKFKWWK